jgi:hypothetical protein
MPEAAPRTPPWWRPGKAHRLSAAVVVATNAAVLWQAASGGWSLGSLLWTYWWQSVVLGGLHMLRLVLLRRYDTTGLKRGDGVPIQPSPHLPGCMALLFAVHFGLFHLVYALFLAVLAVRFGAGGTSAAAVAMLGVGQLFQFVESLRRDRAGRPNLGALFITPYARILPMHLILIAGIWFVSGLPALLLFVALKTAAEIVSLGLEDRLAGAADVAARNP